MADDQKPKVNPNVPPVKLKIKPYPIETTINKGEGTPQQKGQILKLTQVGFMLRTFTDIYKVGEFHIATFELPALHKFIREEVKVIKTYDMYDEIKKGQMGTVYTIEFHFKKLTDENLRRINKFLAVIHQV